MVECTLFLAGLDLFSVDARDFVGKGSFSGVWLIKPQRLGPRSRSKPGYLVELPNATRHFLTTPDATDQRPQVVTRGPGVWRARINVMTAENLTRVEERFFEWEYGSVPSFVTDPRIQT
jgi:hypothetical protein